LVAVGLLVLEMRFAMRLEIFVLQSGAQETDEKNMRLVIREDRELIKCYGVRNQDSSNA
jgi:hypothetical protein